jgi:hypothetical protein
MIATSAPPLDAMVQEQGGGDGDGPLFASSHARALASE